MTNNRRSFLRDCFMIAAVSLLPKILRPMESEIEPEEGTYLVCYDPYKNEGGRRSTTFLMKRQKGGAYKIMSGEEIKGEYNLIEKYSYNPNHNQ